MANRILLSLLLLGSITSTVHSQTANMRHVATVDLHNRSTVGVDWMVTDSTRYWYDAQGDYIKTETYCYDSTNYSYYVCRKVEYYHAADTSITTMYDYNSSLLALEQEYCSFNRTDSVGRTLETGSCYNPNGDNWSYYRNYYSYDTLGRVKQFRAAHWSSITQRLSNTQITDYFYDTLGYTEYNYTQSYSNGTLFLSQIGYDSVDVAGNVSFEIILEKETPTSNWDTLWQVFTFYDTVVSVITKVRIEQNSYSGALRPMVKDSTITDTINFTLEQHRFVWNDTVQMWQQISRHFAERDSTGRTIYSESANAPYTGAPIFLTNESTYTHDSLGRMVFRLTHSYDYRTGVLRYIDERNTEYDVPVGDSTAHITISTSLNMSDSLTVTSKDEVYFDSLTHRVEYRYATFDTNAQDWQPQYWGYYYYDESLLIGMEDIAFDRIDLNLLPNPTSGTANIHFIAKVATLGTLTIHDVSGRQVLAQNIQISAGENEVAINLKALGIPSAGLYLVKLTSPEAQYTGKLLYQP